MSSRSATAAEPPEFLEAEKLADLLRINRNSEAASRDEIPGTIWVVRVLRFRRDAGLAWSPEAG